MEWYFLLTAGRGMAVKNKASFLRLEVAFTIRILITIIEVLYFSNNFTVIAEFSSYAKLVFASFAVRFLKVLPRNKNRSLLKSRLILA